MRVASARVAPMKTLSMSFCLLALPWGFPIADDVFLPEVAGNSTAAASKAAANRPARVARTVALTETNLPIERLIVAFISSGCGAAVSETCSAGKRSVLAVIGIAGRTVTVWTRSSVECAAGIVYMEKPVPTTLLQSSDCSHKVTERSVEPSFGEGKLPGRVTSSPQQWRDRAACMRALALMMKDAEVITLMTDLAADYEKLADRTAAKMAKEVAATETGTNLMIAAI
jgi:hypothetical protein